jgi:hypothetical protein
LCTSVNAEHAAAPNGGPVDRLRARRLLTVLCACLAWSRLAVAAAAQSSTATIRVEVVDPSNAVVADAAITLTSPETGQRREGRSSPDGSLQWVAVTPGWYRLGVVVPGFAAFDRAIEVTADQALVLRIMVPLARQTDAVAVIATEHPLFEPSKTAPGRTITTSDIADFPLAGRQVADLTRLATLTPGIVTDVTTAFSTIATAGQTGANNTFLLDGLSIDDANTGAIRGTIPVDAIKEIRVVSNQFGAEYGQASGAVVNVVTRSGSNRPSGRLYYFHQDGAWNATSAPARRVGARDPALQQTIAGGVWGGPLRRDRAFILASAEQVVTHSTYVNTSPVASSFRPGDPLTQPVDLHAPKAFGRTDLNLTSSNVLTLRYRDNHGTGTNVVREPLSAAERGRDVTDLVRDAAALDTHVIGSAAVNELRLQWSRRAFAWDVSRFCPGCAALNYPSIILGKPANAPQDNVADRWQAADVVTVLVTGAGRHALKVGVDASVNQHRGVTPLNFSGTYLFRADLPFDPANKDSYPVSFTQNAGNADVRVQERIIATFAQDEWQPRDRLAVNFGVRWDHTDWPGPSSRRDDVAPRLGVSMDPWGTGTTAIRAGAGRYYDESLLQIARDAETGFVQTAIANPGFQGDAAHADPFGANPNRVGPAVPLFSITQYAATETPYTDQLSIGIQRQLGRDVNVTGDLVRARGHRLPVGRDLNYPDPTTHLRPDPDRALQQIIATESRGESWYTGLQVGLQHRFAQSYAYSLAYTWSSAENDTDGARNFPQDQTNLLGDRGPMPNDARHRLSASTVLNVPFGCRLATLVTARSALPYNVTTGSDNNNDNVFNDRPPGRGRNAARGSALFQADVRLSRTLRFSARRIELLIEAFNVTNRANWTDYNGKVSAASFGQPGSAAPPRQLQLGARFDF